MGRVVVVGSSNTDLVCRAAHLPAPGETVRGSTFATYPGGKGANQAVAAARAGAAVTFVGAIGDDAFGPARLADLECEGIDVANVERRTGNASGVALIIVADDGENQIVLVPGANDTVEPERAAAVVAAGGHDVLSTTHEVPFETVVACLRAKPAGMRAVHNAAPVDPRLIPHLSLIDVLICNEVEASALLGRRVDPASALDAARALQALGCASSIVTLGERGAYVAAPGDVWHTPATAVAAVDTTGAGDAFCGTLAAWLAAGVELREAVAAGVCAGTIAVTREGAQPSLPRRDEILAALTARPDR